MSRAGRSVRRAISSWIVRPQKRPWQGPIPAREKLLSWLGPATWAGSGKLPLALTVVGGLVVTFVVVGCWSYFTHLAVEPPSSAHLDDALAALDAGDLELAKARISDLQDDEADAALLGGALFVLGAVRAAEADAEYSEARRRTAHLAAGRYLQKASALGFPDGRETEGEFLMGRSLVLGNQLQPGIEALTRLRLQIMLQLTEWFARQIDATVIRKIMHHVQHGQVGRPQLR